jgi:hypothetical protein
VRHNHAKLRLHKPFSARDFLLPLAASSRNTPAEASHRCEAVDGHTLPAYGIDADKTANRNSGRRDCRSETTHAL